MPTQVQQHPATRTHHLAPPGPLPMQGQRQHSEALKMALGSILAPRRPSPPVRSMSSQGNGFTHSSYASQKSTRDPSPSHTPTSTHFETAMPIGDVGHPVASIPDRPSSAVTPAAPENPTLKARRPSVTRRHSEGTLAELAANGKETPKGRFIETLSSKSAWDALIHGSFS